MLGSVLTACPRLEEFLRRKARLQRVEESVQRKIVIGFFDTLFWARRFRRALEAKRAGRMTAVPQFEFTMVEDASSATSGGRLTPGSNIPSPSLSPVASHMSLDSNYFANYGRPPPGPPAPPSIDTEAGFRSRANSIQKTPVQSRANSIQATPVQSPMRGPSSDSGGGFFAGLANIPLSPTMSPTTSPHASQAPDPAELNWQLAEALNLSRPSSPHTSVSPGPPGVWRSGSGAGSASGAGVGVSSGLSRMSEMEEPPTAGTGARSRQNSDVSAQDVLEVLDNSIWGDSIRRSFTLRRPPGGQGR